MTLFYLEIFLKKNTFMLINQTVPFFKKIEKKLRSWLFVFSQGNTPDTPHSITSCFPGQSLQPPASVELKWQEPSPTECVEFLTVVQGVFLEMFLQSGINRNILLPSTVLYRLTSAPSQSAASWEDAREAHGSQFQLRN